MGNDSTKNSSQETVTISPEVAKKIEDLQEKLAVKEQEIKTVKEKTIDVIKKIKAEAKSESEIQTNLPARIIKQNTFKGQFHNGYADGTVEKARKELRKTQRKASVAK